jgi:tRNA(Ile)-lysidine synthase TilS/MesJ
MQRISTKSFLEFCSSLEGQEQRTLARQARFMVKVVDDGLVFIPGSSNKSRTHKRNYVERMLEDFAHKDHSRKTSDYNGYTADASYQIALMDKYVKSHI